ncbi:hypothetical protein KIW84_075574 [Lathyrus oleraceus]|uniref:CCHC-type domain-containing protein n=1 Tax=Pisum sativum TaxID=3888 RepID=A0A9D4VU34_PEA|nr:hypothetical protein KIW84_075574 [Pisum sativum]
MDRGFATRSASAAGSNAGGKSEGVAAVGSGGLGVARSLGVVEKSCRVFDKNYYDGIAEFCNWEQTLSLIDRILALEVAVKERFKVESKWISGCGEVGHISPQCPKPKKENQSGGKVFALSGSETAADDRLIRGN